MATNFEMEPRGASFKVSLDRSSTCHSPNNLSSAKNDSGKSSVSINANSSMKREDKERWQKEKKYMQNKETDKREHKGKAR